MSALTNISQDNKLEFAIEHINDDQKLFYRINLVNIDIDVKDGMNRIKPVAFDPQPKPNSLQMSVNWEKYSTADQTKNLGRKPEKNGVVSFISRDVRACASKIDVTHAPTHIQAHSHIHDVKSEEDDPEVRIRLRDMCAWEIYI